MFRISGFIDETGLAFDKQLELCNKLGQKYVCLRRVLGSNITDYTAERFKTEVVPMLDKVGINISSIGSNIGKIELSDDEGYKAELVKLQQMRKICEMTGCKYIRTFSFYVDKNGNYDEYFPKVVERIRGYLEVIKDSDIILLHENEKKIYGDVPERVLKLYNEINNPQFKLCYDASNYMQCGIDALKAYEMTKEMTVYYHMKDCVDKVEVPLGLGKGNIDTIISDLNMRGYDGFLTLEPHTAKYAALKTIIYLLPIKFGMLSNFNRVFRYIDKSKNIKKFQKVTIDTVYVWQYENMIQILKKAGAKYE